ncbi:MAG: hypothetical protein ACK4OI_04260, partial [Rhizobium oryzihabitans]
MSDSDTILSAFADGVLSLTLNRPDAFRFDSVGKPLPSVQLKLAEDGEILAKGPNVFGGYHKDPAA